MATQTVTTAQPSLFKRIGKKAYRVLALMTEGAYQSYQAQRAPYYSTI
ncbi:hypothetical protein [Modicisalibacter luteus]|jgi:hypothetical protein|uniref:Uncharacterized protein n=1 Tax=Modicisalibacter luteus TaxID=453962 RepID=A0ABV7LY84_9GAMM|nr:hypothetical protein [Halomonas lutea]GHB04779.1 hypothetical protein GCM10007159_28270 [Halomonas lutea]